MSVWLVGGLDLHSGDLSIYVVLLVHCTWYGINFFDRPQVCLIQRHLSLKREPFVRHWLLTKCT